MTDADSKKRQIIAEIFTKYRTADTTAPYITVNNEVLKAVSSKYGFRNMFDATKFNTYDSMPECMKKDGSFIVHTGRGNHVFIRGTGFHYFEELQKTKSWKISPSIVSSLGNSEADTASTLFNDKIIHDFLFGNPSAEVRIHNSRRSTIDYEFWIGKNRMFADRLQIEMDALFECEDTIATVEVKNIKHSNFEIRQIYSTFRYLDRFRRDGKIPNNFKLRHLFVTANKGKNGFFRLYEYTFTDWKQMDSIKLVQNAQYNLLRE